MRLKKILIIFMIICSFSILLQVNKVQAALQSSGDTPTTKDRNTWMVQVRSMESLGGTLGLSETQNEDLTSSSGSNNLDIHMQKNTEYGAMALLSASAYGNSVKVEDGATTTGNETGVVIRHVYEWTAAQFTDYYGKTSYADRYINYYVAKDYETKIGDALIETQKWHNTTGFYYAYSSPNQFNAPGGLLRGKDGIFAFYNVHRNNSGSDDDAAVSKVWTSRAVIINGDGI